MAVSQVVAVTRYTSIDSRLERANQPGLLILTQTIKLKYLSNFNILVSTLFFILFIFFLIYLRFHSCLRSCAMDSICIIVRIHSKWLSGFRSNGIKLCCAFGFSADESKVEYNVISWSEEPTPVNTIAWSEKYHIAACKHGIEVGCIYMHEYTQ